MSLELASSMNTKFQNFYGVASDQLGLIEEVPDVFDHLAEDHGWNRKTLQIRI